MSSIATILTKRLPWLHGFPMSKLVASKFVRLSSSKKERNEAWHTQKTVSQLTDLSAPFMISLWKGRITSSGDPPYSTSSACRVSQRELEPFSSKEGKGRVVDGLTS